MAVTPSRTRNQTTLNNLAKMLAGLNGEYSFCTDLLNAGELEGADLVRLRTHVAGLESKREALRLTLLQFDPRLDVDSIRGTETWRARLGHTNLSSAGLRSRLLAELKR
jgi:hypothetical protein